MSGGGLGRSTSTGMLSSQLLSHPVSAEGENLSVRLSLDSVDESEPRSMHEFLMDSLPLVGEGSARAERAASVVGSARRTSFNFSATVGAAQVDGNKTRVDSA